MTPEKLKMLKEAVKAACEAGEWAVAAELLDAEKVNLCFYCQENEPVEANKIRLAGDARGNTRNGTLCKDCFEDRIWSDEKLNEALKKVVDAQLAYQDYVAQNEQMEAATAAITAAKK